MHRYQILRIRVCSNRYTTCPLTVDPALNMLPKIVDPFTWWSGCVDGQPWILFRHFSPLQCSTLSFFCASSRIMTSFKTAPMSQKPKDFLRALSCICHDSAGFIPSPASQSPTRRTWRHVVYIWWQWISELLLFACESSCAKGSLRRFMPPALGRLQKHENPKIPLQIRRKHGYKLPWREI